MHPFEFLFFQLGGLTCMCVFPVHVMAFLCVVTYVAYHGQLDHSGIDFQGDFPWQPGTKYHDDHHKYFHLNFGQNIILWDWLFGTLRQQGRQYGESVYVGEQTKQDS